MADEIRPQAGERWRHYKGGVYRALAIARMECDGETGDEMVVYAGLSGVWIRPLWEWLETVNDTPRFTRMKEQTNG